MGILDSFRKDQEREQKHATPPPAGHTVAEILNDRSNSYLFGALLERDGQQELGQRVKEGKLEKDDVSLLAEYRKKFSEKISQSEKIEKLLTEENIIEIARKHSDFAKIIDIIPPKKAIKVIRDQLKQYIFTDEEKFNAIAEPIEVYDGYKNEKYKETSDSIEKICEDMGISQREYLNAVAIKDPKEKEKALKKLARGGREGWDRVWNIISRKGAKNLRELKDSESLMKSSIAELDSYKTDIGFALFLSISSDDMREALSREMISESMPVIAETKIGFSDLKKESAGAFNEDDFNGSWEALKVKEDYGALFDHEQDAIKDRFLDEQKKAYRERNVKNKGFWASIFAALFEEKINSKRDTLK